MKTSNIIAGAQREICPHCASELTAAIRYTDYNPAPYVSECGAIREYVCGTCGIKFISTADRDRLRANLQVMIEREKKDVEEEHREGRA